MGTIAYMLDPLASNSMKSANPHSGFHRIHASPCLDTSVQSPTRNAGGAVIVQSRGNIESVAVLERLWQQLEKRQG